MGSSIYPVVVVRDFDGVDGGGRTVSKYRVSKITLVAIVSN